MCYMKTDNLLCICDLDGTLLLPGGRLSVKTKSCLNTLIKNGAKITISTARTPATLEYVLCGLKINLPVACMNGSVIYDLQEKKYLKKHKISMDNTIKVIKVFKQFNLNVFTHCAANGGILDIYHGEFTNYAERDFYELRKPLLLKNYIKGDPKCNDVVFFASLNKKEILIPVWSAVNKLDGIKTSFYEDVYNKGYYFLEIYSENASKKSALYWLSKYCKANKTIAFGDNDNDISMLKAADVAYAVENASDKCKQSADIIIGSNKNDSVAKMLASIYGYKYK